MLRLTQGMVKTLGDLLFGEAGFAHYVDNSGLCGRGINRKDRLPFRHDRAIRDKIIVTLNLKEAAEIFSVSHSLLSLLVFLSPRFRSLHSAKNAIAFSSWHRSS
jgi:hypothetical protein